MSGDGYHGWLLHHSMRVLGNTVESLNTHTDRVVECEILTDVYDEYVGVYSNSTHGCLTIN